MITVTFDIDKDGSVEPLLIRKLREFCIEEFGQEPVLLQTHVRCSADFDEDDYSDEDEFIPCSRCDGHDACADYGCAFEHGLGHMVQQEPGSDGVF